MARNRPEETLQRSVADFLAWACPDLLWWATANQRGSRPRWEMGVLKAMGVRAGVSDLCLVIPPHGKIGAIELKAPHGALSAPQRRFRDQVVQAGGQWALCRSLEEFVVVLARWGVPMRTHRLAP